MRRDPRALFVCLAFVGACCTLPRYAPDRLPSGVFRTPPRPDAQLIRPGLLHAGQAKELVVEDDKVTIRYVHEGRQVVEVWRRQAAAP